MGWVMLALVAVAASALLALLRLPRLLWPLGGAAVMLAAAGYALQGAPDLPAHPVAEPTASLEQSAAYRKLRGDLWGQYGGEAMYFGISDPALRGGKTDTAIRILTGGVDYAPTSAAMWSELGTVIALHDQAVSPAALIAFRRAIELAPEHPGPPYLLALAYIRTGQAGAAEPWLARAGTLTPKDASYRAEMLRVIDETARGARFTPTP